MSATLIYLLTVVLPNIHSSFAPLAVLSFIVTIVLIIATCISGSCSNNDSDATQTYNTLKPMAKIMAGFAIFFTLLYDASPDEKQLYMVAGAYAVTNTKDVAALPDNVVKVANAWLDKAADAAHTVKDTVKEVKDATKAK